jgi:hypothetical protein
METLGMTLSEKPFYDIADADFLDVWDSDINPVRTFDCPSVGNANTPPFTGCKASHLYNPCLAGEEAQICLLLSFMSCSLLAHE